MSDDEHVLLVADDLGRFAQDHLDEPWRPFATSSASATARGDGSIVSRSTNRPSALDTTFCATTRMSPSSGTIRIRAQRAGEQRRQIVARRNHRDAVERLEGEPSSSSCLASAPGTAGP